MIGRCFPVDSSAFRMAAVASNPNSAEAYSNLGLALKGQGMDGRDQDDTILIPLTTAQRQVFGSQFPGSVRMVMVQTTTQEIMPAVEKSMTDLLRQRHRIREGMDNDFFLRNLTAAWYQREIAVPKAWTGRRIVLSVEYLNSLATVFVDKEKAGDVRFPAGEVDLTPGNQTISTVIPFYGTVTTTCTRTSAAAVAGSITVS